MNTFQVEPKVGMELCKLWEQDHSRMGKNSRYQSRPGVSRGRAKPSNQSAANSPKPGIASHGHWQASPPALPRSAVYQFYASHAASMPIPVTIPSAHSRHSFVQQAFPRSIQAVDSAPVSCYFCNSTIVTTTTASSYTVPTISFDSTRSCDASEGHWADKLTTGQAFDATLRACAKINAIFGA